MTTIINERETKMKVYSDLYRYSDVYGYEFDETSITIWFKGADKTYKYSYQKVGKYHVDNMKILAQKGDGLNEYINNHVRNAYD